MGEKAVLNSRNNRGVKTSNLWLNRPKPWLHITLGIILALASTVAINLLVARYGEKIYYEQPVRALEAQGVEQSIISTSELTVEYIWQQPSSLQAVILGMLIAFISASLAYLILNRMLSEDGYL